MDEDAVVERIRADADLLDDGHTDIDALVNGAMLRGRRQRTGRRLAGFMTCAVAAGVAITLLGGLPTSLRTGPSVVPVGPPPQVSTSSPAKTRSPAPPASPDRVSGTPGKVQQTLTDLLPAAARVTHASAARDTGTNGFAWEHTTALTVDDVQGTSYILGGIGNGTYDDACFNLPDCTKTTLPSGGTLWVTSSPGGDKSGTDLTFSYNRPQGGHIWMMERNFATGGGPVTRDALLLNKAAARRLVTSPAWDTLFTG